MAVSSDHKRYLFVGARDHGTPLPGARRREAAPLARNFMTIRRDLFTFDRCVGDSCEWEGPIRPEKTGYLTIRGERTLARVVGARRPI